VGSLYIAVHSPDDHGIAKKNPSLVESNEELSCIEEPIVGLQVRQEHVCIEKVQRNGNIAFHSVTLKQWRFLNFWSVPLEWTAQSRPKGSLDLPWAKWAQSTLSYTIL
jgi:hypothetical protein